MGSKEPSEDELRKYGKHLGLPQSNINATVEQEMQKRRIRKLEDFETAYEIATGEEPKKRVKKEPILPSH